MSQKEIFSIAIKVLSLWFLCQLFLHVTSVLPFILNTLKDWSSIKVPAWAYIAICLSFLMAGVIISKLLFSVSNSILSKLSSKSDISLPESDHKFILQICGLFFLLPSLIQLPSSFSFLFNPELREITWNLFLRPFYHMLQLCLGAWLVVDPSWWSVLLTKLRGRA